MVAAAFIAGLLGGPPPGWIPHPGPGPEFEGDRVCANHSRRAWGVQRVDDTVRVAPWTEELRQDPLPFPISFQEVLPQPPQRPGAGVKQSWNAAVYAEKYARRTVVPLRDGWLIGFDAGEYGGSLWWYTSPLAPGVKLSSDNVLRLLSTSDESIVLVLVGIAHMGIDEG